MSKKLKFGLKPKLHKQFDGQLGTIDISYDPKNDSINVAVAFRKDVTDPELFGRIYDFVSKSLRSVHAAIAGEDSIKDVCGCKDNSDIISSYRGNITEDIIAMLATVDKKKK
jgi:hypothetical protein